VSHRPNGSRRHREDFDAIRVGSVIRWNGRLRTIRTVSRYPDGTIFSVGFAKLRKSQYCGPMTYYFRTDIRRAFSGIVANRKGPLCSIDVECRLTKAIENDTDAGNRSGIHQDETVGVIW
jgi:hypothetical protein